MKRIYLLVTLLCAMATGAFAQRTCNIELTSNMTNPDTFLYNAGGAKTYHIITWRFKNLGPDNILATDTLKFKYPLASLNLYSPAGPNAIFPGGGIPHDSTVTWRDTVGWTGAPTPNPAQWCDSVWVKPMTGTVTDVQTNNHYCKSVRFIQDPLSVSDLAANAENGLAIYPNPASSSVKLAYNFTTAANANVIVRDLAGRTVINKDLGKNSGAKEFTLDISALTPGLYFVELTADEKKTVSRLSVQK